MGSLISLAGIVLYVVFFLGIGMCKIFSLLLSKKPEKDQRKLRLSVYFSIFTVIPNTPPRTARISDLSLEMIIFG